MARGIAWSLTEPKFSSHALVDGELTLLSAAAVVRRQTSAAVVRHGAPVPARSPMMPCTQHATCQPLPTLIPRVTGCTGRAWRSCAFPWQLCCVAAQFSRCQRAAVLHLIDFGWRLLCMHGRCPVPPRRLDHRQAMYRPHGEHVASAPCSCEMDAARRRLQCCPRFGCVQRLATRSFCRRWGLCLLLWGLWQPCVGWLCLERGYWCAWHLCVTRHKNSPYTENSYYPEPHSRSL